MKEGTYLSSVSKMYIIDDDILKAKLSKVELENHMIAGTNYKSVKLPHGLFFSDMEISI